MVAAKFIDGVHIDRMRARLQRGGRRAAQIGEDGSALPQVFL
jgi:hypothetical protein